MNEGFVLRYEPCGADSGKEVEQSKEAAKKGSVASCNWAQQWQRQRRCLDCRLDYTLLFLSSPNHLSLFSLPHSILPLLDAFLALHGQSFFLAFSQSYASEFLFGSSEEMGFLSHALNHRIYAFENLYSEFLYMDLLIKKKFPGIWFICLFIYLAFRLGYRWSWVARDQWCRCIVQWLRLD